MKINNKLQPKKGFTLVELILAMGILTILMTVIMRVFIDMIELRLEAEAESAVTQDARYIYARLAYDINRATAVTVPASAGASGSSMTLTIDGSPHTYTVDGSNRLTLNSGSSTETLTSEGTRVDAVSFTRRGGVTGVQSVTVNMMLDSKIQTVRGPVSREINTTLSTR